MLLTPSLLHLHSADCGRNKGSHDNWVLLLGNRGCQKPYVESGLQVTSHMQHARYVQGKFYVVLYKAP